MTPRRLQACERAASSCAGQGRRHKAHVGGFGEHGRWYGCSQPGQWTRMRWRGPFRKDRVKTSSLLLSIRVMAAGESCAWAETGCVASPADNHSPCCQEAWWWRGRRSGAAMAGADARGVASCAAGVCIWCIYRSSHESYGYGPSLLLHPGCCEVPKVAASKGARMMAQNATMSAAHSMYILQPQGTYFFGEYEGRRSWESKGTQSTPAMPPFPLK